MRLFSDSDLFTTGSITRKEFEIPNGDLLLIDNFIAKKDADTYFKILVEETNWQDIEINLFDKRVTVPRKIAWYKNEESWTKDPQSNWIFQLNKIKEKVQQELAIKFNAVLLNLYRNGNDGVSWHSDKTSSINKNMIIVSVTFGETRMFRLRHKYLKNHPVIEIPLHHGSLLVMAGETNSYWEHQIPKTKKEILPRINLTFRQIVS